MPRIFDYNLEVHDRFATLASIAALKGSGQKFIETTADSAEDAAAAEAAGIEMAVVEVSALPAVREGSKRLFISAAIDFMPDPPYAIDDLLRTSVRMMEQGADAIHTCRSPASIRRLVDEDIPVMGHVGFVPRQSSVLGGIRGVGKTAEEAKVIWDQIRQLEDAGVFAVECELVAAPMMKEITKRTSMATMSLGSGPDADILGLFMSDICGLGAHIPRHARSYADLNRLYAQIEEEKLRALTEFRADALDGSFPSSGETIAAPDDEVERFIEMLES
ncbi:MAG: ketopantoate hydroxymethyltransferase [Acidimicrobiales bacterium]|nr:ketopantoate hydroxymethyltransferase [Acidimicrobiales bacterium]RZV47238.1 MAG: ketopantoate hydroxymethyltransferase [Acidimicrobiales bacterium]